MTSIFQVPTTRWLRLVWSLWFECSELVTAYRIPPRTDRWL